MASWEAEGRRGPQAWFDSRAAVWIPAVNLTSSRCMGPSPGRRNPKQNQPLPWASPVNGGDNNAPRPIESSRIQGQIGAVREKVVRSPHGRPTAQRGKNTSEAEQGIMAPVRLRLIRGCGVFWGRGLDTARRCGITILTAILLRRQEGPVMVRYKPETLAPPTARVAPLTRRERTG